MLAFFGGKYLPQKEAIMPEKNMRWNRQHQPETTVPRGKFNVRLPKVGDERTFYRIIHDIRHRKQVFMQTIYHGLRYQSKFAKRGLILNMPDPSQWRNHLLADHNIKQKLNQLYRVTMYLMATRRKNYMAEVNAQLGDLINMRQEGWH
jgi:hypothetical protein